MADGTLKHAGQAPKTNGQDPERFRKRAALLEEAKAAGEALDRFPIWVQVKGEDNAKDAFALLLSYLRGKGHCFQDVQSDPHRSLGLVDYFQVSRREEGAREPELLGTVSLYSDSKGKPFVIKLSAEIPAFTPLFMGAVEEMVGLLIEKRGTEGKVSLDIRVSQAHDFEK